MARTKLYPPSVDPGFPELPPTPAGWRRATFGDALEVVERPIKLDAGSTYKLLTARRNRGGIALRGEMLGSEVLTKTQFRVKTGDFVISRRQIIHGACGTVPPDLDEAIVSNEYSVLRTRPGLLMDFLRHYSHTRYFQRTCFHSSHGVDVEKMIFKLEEWLDREIDLPPLREQRKIAAILSAADEVIEKTQAVIDQLRNVKRTLMQELLTRGLPGRHSQFKTTEIGQIPEQWTVLRVQEAGEVLAGRAKDVTAAGKRRPYLRVANVMDGYIDTADVLEMPFTDAEFARYELRSGDVLLNEGQSLELVGRCSMYRGEFDGSCGIQNALIRFRAGPAIMPEFAEQLFRWYQQSGRFTQIATKTTSIAHLGVQRFANMKIALPALAEQQDMVTMLASTDARISAELAGAKQLKAAKSALMSVLLTGEIRVTPEEEAA